MARVFAGLAASNVILMIVVFGLGFGAVGADRRPTDVYAVHLTLGILAGLFCALTHVSAFTYFMATSRWLREAAVKGALEEREVVEPALRRKTRALALAMTAIAVTVITMFMGAAVDPAVRLEIPSTVHLALGLLAIVMNLGCAAAEFQLIRVQSEVMDAVAARLNTS
ncbi:MAG: hypothetical protein CMJ18_11350 [Phycisphaeraceae bacterium]|nr:hypothetical protein [Phycisphaeraceae bacterium]